VAFTSEAHLPPGALAMTDQEADDVYANAAGQHEWGGWGRFKTELKAISKHHIGVFIHGLRSTQDESMSVLSRSQGSFIHFTEELAIDLLHANRLLDIRAKSTPSIEVSSWIRF